jgi:hypothetical protein
MNRTLGLKIANYLLYLFTCSLAGIGFALANRLPSRGESRNLLLLGLKRHDWVELHLIFAIGFALVALWHVGLNWSWVKKVAASNNGFALLASVGLGILLVLIPLLAPIQSN